MYLNYCEKFIVFFSLINVLYIYAWDLTNIDDSGLNFITKNNEFNVIHVSVFYLRAFLTIQNRWNFTKNTVTIVEAPWPENILPIKPRIFPNDLAHAKSTSDCNGIIQTVGTAVDYKNGLLWLIDNGSIYCSPKLIIYDLLRRNNEISRYVFEEFKGNSFKSIHLQFKYDKIIDLSSQFDQNVYCNAFITVNDENFILIYSQKEKIWQKLWLKTALSVPNEITIRNNDELIVSDKMNNLWVGNLTKIREDRRRKLYTIDLIYLGELMGKSTSLIVASGNDDILNDYLYYYMPRDGAVVRWDFRKPLRAEGHDVVHFSRRSVVQIIFGAKGSVWTVHSVPNEIGDHCTRIVNYYLPIAMQFSI